MTTVLRDYQELAIKQIGECVRNGARSVCFVAPTGTGKTKTMAELFKRHLAKVPHGRTLWLAHREELVVQAYRDLVESGLDVGAIMADPSPMVVTNPYRATQVASIQTIIARDIVLDDITLVCHDEAHHGPSKLWSEVVLAYKKKGALIIGPTATPVRGDGIGLGDIYDSIVQPISAREAIDRGFLVPYQLIRPERPLGSKQIAARPVDAYLAHASGRKAAVFAPNVKTAYLFRDEFETLNISAGVVTGAMNGADRSKALSDYRDGRVRVLISVGVLMEGWDDPPTSCVIMARWTDSLSFYLQAVGRGLRIAPWVGKLDCIILDLHGCSHEHGAPDDPRDWQLEGDALGRKPLDAPPERFCKVCGLYIDKSVTICPGCGIAPAETLPPEVVNARLVKYAWKQKEGPEQRAQSLGKWMYEAAKAGHKLGRATYKYKAVYGKFPPQDVQILARRVVQHLEAEAQLKYDAG